MISAIRGECSGYPEKRFSSGQKRLNKGGDRVLKEEQEFCQARKEKMNILGRRMALVRTGGIQFCCVHGRVRSMFRLNP